MAGTINDQILNSLKSLTTNHSTSNKMKADIDMQTTDWLALLVAQLKNQDMNNTMDTGEMMSQMAQFSQIQSIQNMVAMQESIHAMDVTSYATSLMGKEVTVAEMTTTTNSKGEKEDVLVTKKGIVSGVTLFQGEPIIYIDKKPYGLSQIMIVGEVPDNPADAKPDSPEIDNTLPDALDKEKVDKAKPLVEAAITAITATNSTTAEDILDAVTNSISSLEGAVASWKTEPTITPATEENAGIITGTIVLTCGSATVEVTINKTIAQLGNDGGTGDGDGGTEGGGGTEDGTGETK